MSSGGPVRLRVFASVTEVLDGRGRVIDRWFIPRDVALRLIDHACEVSDGESDAASR